MAADVKDLDLELESDSGSEPNPFDKDFVDEVGDEADEVMQSARPQPKGERKTFVDPDLEDDDDNAEEPGEVARNEKGQFVSTKPDANKGAKTGEAKTDEATGKADTAPARAYIPTSLIDEAMKVGIRPEVAATYGSVRELDAEIFSRKTKLLSVRGHRQQPDAEDRGQTKADAKAPEPFKFELDERSMDEPTVKALRSAETFINQLQSRVAQQDQTIAGLNGLRDEWNTERRETAEARQRDRALATERGFDEAVVKDEALKAFLGRPSEVYGQPGSEQYARWMDPGFQDAINFKLARHFERNSEHVMPDWNAILRFAVNEAWPELAKKQAQNELQASLNKGRGSVAIRGADRAPVRRRPRNEDEDRARFKADYERVTRG